MRKTPHRAGLLVTSKRAGSLPQGGLGFQGLRSFLELAKTDDHRREGRQYHSIRHSNSESCIAQLRTAATILVLKRVYLMLIAHETRNDSFGGRGTRRENKNEKRRFVDLTCSHEAKSSN
jgi:hypothetical protein